MPSKGAERTGSRARLDAEVLAALEGGKELAFVVRIILRGHRPAEIRDVLYLEGARYRRLNGPAFRELVEGLRLAGVLW